MRLLLTICLLLSPEICQCQEFISLSGSVRDAETLGFLPSASIVLRNQPIGTIANNEGRFTIHLPAEYKNDSLYISVIGYHSKQVPIANIAGEFEVLLTPSVQYLQEIVFSDSISTEAILKRAFDGIKSNYSFKPFLLTGFYREIQKADSSYVSLIEASARLYSNGYKNAKHEKVDIAQMRRSLQYKHPLASFWNETNLLYALLQQNFIKYERKSLTKFRKATRKDEILIDNVPVYVITLELEGWYWPAILYIRRDNYAVIRIQENFHHIRDGENVWKVSGNPMIESHAQTKFMQFDFHEYLGKYYLSNLVLKFSTHYKDALTGNKFLEFTLDQQFVVTNIVVDNPGEIERPLDKYDNLHDLTVKYDPGFWANYNAVRDTPLDSAIRRDLEKKLKLEAQFNR